MALSRPSDPVETERAVVVVLEATADDAFDGDEPEEKQ